MIGRNTVRGAIGLAFFVLATSACKKESQTTSTIPATWRNPEYTGQPFSELFVMGVGRNEAYRRLYEDSMVRALETEGVSAEASWVRFPDSGKLDKAEVLVAVSEGGFDAVVIARLLRVDDQVVYVPGKPPTSSDEYMSGYDEAYAVKSDPGHYRTDRTYSVETAVYSIRDKLLVWVVRSETVNPESVEQIIDIVSSSVAKKMNAEGLLRGPPGTGYPP